MAAFGSLDLFLMVLGYQHADPDWPPGAGVQILTCIARARQVHPTHGCDVPGPQFGTPTLAAPNLGLRCIAITRKLATQPVRSSLWAGRGP